MLNSNANTYNWDFGDDQFGNSTGSISHEYSAPGEYAVAVFGCMTNCLPINSCSFQLIDFEIIDTTTSVTNVDGKSLGISAYPNPATDRINLFIPSSLGEQHYTILDMTGGIVVSGKANGGNTSIDALNIPDGIYTLQIRPVSNPNGRVAYVRVIVMKE